MPQTVILEIGPGSRIVRLVTLGTVAGIAVLASDDIRWAAVVVATIVVTIASVVIVSVVSAVAVSECTANCQTASKS
jgi:hypothetical protein